LILTEARAPVVVPVMVISVKDCSEDFADATGEPWAARHNQEIWRMAPGGVYEAVTPPSVCASAMR